MERIAIISQFFYPSSASTAQLMTDLAAGFAKRGYSTKVFTAVPQGQYITPQFLQQVEIYRSFNLGDVKKGIISKVISSIFFLFGALKYIIFQVPKETSLLIVSNPPYAGILGLFFKLVKGGSYYFLEQDVFPDSALMSGVIKQSSLYYQFFLKLNYSVYKSSRATIVLTSSMKKYLELKTGLNNKFCTIENWAIEDIDICDKQNNQFAIEHGFNKIFTVQYSGNIGRLHDIETIVSAANLLQDSPIQFVFIGDGPKKKIVESYIDKYRLKNVLLLPFQPRESLSRSLTACDISLVSLIEGAEKIIAPCKLYGILASGRAVVSISSPGSYIDNLLADNQCGVNCPPNQPQKLAYTIASLALEGSRVQVMGENARKLYEERYVFQRALDEYENLIFEKSLRPNYAQV